MDSSFPEKPSTATNAQRTISRRERDVLALMERGFTNKQIARALYVSGETIKFHVHNVLVKLDASNRTEAVIIWKSLAKAGGNGLDNAAIDPALMRMHQPWESIWIAAKPTEGL